MLFRLVLTCLLASLALAARADAPRVAADIAPVHSLVAQVMDGVGTPELLIDPGASPHGHQLRPSQATALEQAALVVWIGPELAPGLGRAIDSLAGGARKLDLLHMAGTRLLQLREAAVFTEAAHDHDHDHDHDAAGPDAHAWLDPVNAALWLDAIAAALSELDPENAARYAGNAAKAQADLESLTAAIGAQLAPHRGAPFVVLHDGYQYFETRFGLSPLGAVSPSDAARPSPARLAELSAALQAAGATCLFSEPQFDPARIAALAGDAQMRVALLDPIGSTLEPGPALYPALLRGLADGIARCLAP